MAGDRRIPNEPPAPPCSGWWAAVSALVDAGAFDELDA